MSVPGEKIIEAVKETVTAVVEKNLSVLVDARLAAMDDKIAQIAERVAVRAAKA